MTNSELDELVLEYRSTTSERKKNRLYMLICEKYMPYIKSKCKGEIKVDTEDIKQIYHIRVLHAINTWNQKASFSTYMWSVIRGTVDEWVRTNKNQLFKDGKYNIRISDMDDFTAETLRDFCNMSNN